MRESPPKPTAFAKKRNAQTVSIALPDYLTLHKLHRKSGLSMSAIIHVAVKQVVENPQLLPSNGGDDGGTK